MTLRDRWCGLWARCSLAMRRGRADSARRRRRPSVDLPRTDRLEPRELPATVIAFPNDPPPAPAPAPTQPAPASPQPTEPVDAAQSLRRAASAIEQALLSLDRKVTVEASQALEQVEAVALEVLQQANRSLVGVSASRETFDDVSSSARPSFNGTAQAGATVVLYALRDGQTSEPTRIGRVVANRRDGSWSLVANRRLADGPYIILGTQTPPGGREGTPEARARLFIDTAGPRVVGTSFNPTSRIATISLRDVGIGLADPPLEAIQVTRPGSSSLLPITVTAAADFRGSAETQTVTVSINDDRALPAEGYQLRLIASRFTDLADNPLDGEFNRGFPTGDSRPGGDFRVRLHPFRIRPQTIPR